MARFEHDNSFISIGRHPPSLMVPRYYYLFLDTSKIDAHYNHKLEDPFHLFLSLSSLTRNYHNIVMGPLACRTGSLLVLEERQDCAKIRPTTVDDDIGIIGKDLNFQFDFSESLSFPYCVVVRGYR